MKFGFQLPTGREGLSLPTPFFKPDDFVSIAQTAERLGYDSLWGNDHYAPQDYVRARYPTLPNFFDVFIVLTAVAAATSRIQVGTCVLVLPMRDLVTVARQAATLDQLSGGRLLLGGIGAYKEEHDDLRLCACLSGRRILLGLLHFRRRGGGVRSLSTVSRRESLRDERQVC